MDFLFHALSEKEKEDVRKEAKKIIDDFSEKLSHVRVKEEEPVVERKDFERAEGESSGMPHHEAPTTRPNDSDFKERMLENAPEKNKDFIIAETKKW